MTRSMTIDMSAVPQRPIDMLILDDSDVDRQRMRRFVAQGGINATIIDSDSMESFGTALSSAYFDVVLIDYRLGQRTGIEAVGMLRNHRAQRQAAAIMVTGDRRIELAVEAIRLGCDDFVIKESLDPHVLRTSLISAMLHRRAAPEIKVPAPETTLALRDAVEDVASEMSLEVRNAINAAMARTKNLRGSFLDDPRILAEIAHIDGACSRIWTAVGGFERKMSALDLARPKSPRLGLMKRRMN